MMETNHEQTKNHGPGKWLAVLMKLIRFIIRLLGKRETNR